MQQIAGAFKLSVTIFDPVDADAFRKEVENSLKKTVLVPTAPFKNAAEVMMMMGGMAHQHDLSSIQDGPALDAATQFMEAFIDAGEGWEMVSLSHRLAMVRDLVASGRGAPGPRVQDANW